MSFKFVTEQPNKVVKVSVDYDSDQNLCLCINDIEVGYFDDDGLTLLPDVVSYSVPVELTEGGYFKVGKG